MDRLFINGRSLPDVTLIGFLKSKSRVPTSDCPLKFLVPVTGFEPACPFYKASPSQGDVATRSYTTRAKYLALAVGLEPTSYLQLALAPFVAVGRTRALLIRIIFVFIGCENLYCLLN
jgi:hypothetical protein